MNNTIRKKKADTVKQAKQVKQVKQVKQHNFYRKLDPWLTWKTGSCRKQRESHQGDSGRDGEWTNESEKETYQPTEADQYLEQRGYHDGALNLWRQQNIRA